jgi:hypothetical protein
MRRTTSLFMGMPKAKVICCAIRGHPQVGFRCFMSTTAAMTSGLGPFGPGLLGVVDENSRRYFRGQRSMEAQERGGFQDDGGTDQPARAHEQRAHGGDHPISEAEVGGSSPGAIENQQLLLDEYGFGHHGPHAARTGEPGDRRQEVENQGSQVAHCPIVTSERNPGNAEEL